MEYPKNKGAIFGTRFAEKTIPPCWTANRLSLWRKLSGLLFLGVMCTVATAPRACGKIDRTLQIQVNDLPVTVELAVTEQEKTCGLSFRDALADDQGMLFVFSSDRNMTFWMKDTRIPLSIAFLESSGTILNILDMKPMDTTARYHSAGLARYALEMPVGWFAEHHVKTGDQVQISLPASID
ncbi:MAG: DUF192 domain-containing protein [Gammaproteobacteria bacterium]